MKCRSIPPFVIAISALGVCSLFPIIAAEEPVASDAKPDTEEKPEGGEAEKDSAEKPKGLVTLFDGKSLDNWKPFDCGGSGIVALNKKDGTMEIEFGETLTGAIYQKAADLPKMNYEISVTAMRVDGTDFFCSLTFPVGDLKTCATLVIGGWGGGLTGISSINGLDASENETGDVYKFEDKKWYNIRLRVTEKMIEAWIGDDKIVDVDTEDKKISMRPGDIELYMPLSITTFQTSAAIKEVTFRPVEVKK